MTLESSYRQSDWVVLPVTCLLRVVYGYMSSSKGKVTLVSSLEEFDFECSKRFTAVSVGPPICNVDTHFEMYRQHRGQAFNTKLFGGILLCALASLTVVIRLRKFFFTGETAEGFSELNETFLRLRCSPFELAASGLRPEIQAQIHHWLDGGIDVSAPVAGDCALELAIERFVNHAWTCGRLRIGRTAVLCVK